MRTTALGITTNTHTTPHTDEFYMQYSTSHTKPVTQHTAQPSSSQTQKANTHKHTHTQTSNLLPFRHKYGMANMAIPHTTHTQTTLRHPYKPTDSRHPVLSRHPEIRHNRKLFLYHLIGNCVPVNRHGLTIAMQKACWGPCSCPV